MEGQNPFLLLYLAQAFIGDYAYPAKAWRCIRLKISICVQVIKVACSNGKCLITRSFAQETREQPFSEINQILQEEMYFFHVTPADMQEATQTEAVIIQADKDDSTIIWNPDWLCRTVSLLYICFPVSPKPFSCLLSISKGGIYSNSLFAFSPLSFRFQSSAAEALGCTLSKPRCLAHAGITLRHSLSLCWHWTDKTYLLWGLVQRWGL